VVSAAAGSTNTGTVDPLHEIADLCAEFSVWLHVDAAYGGFAALSVRGAAALEGVQRADSVTLDSQMAVPATGMWCLAGARARRTGEGVRRSPELSG
jgi:cysteine sulfinate desulfinase/cysteine desulfurase-like protein